MRRRATHTIDRPWGAPTALGSRIPLASLIQTLAVAEYLNFRHAANALGVAQSSVSARVKALEEDLGILLFERHARGVRLTEAGRHFVERIAAGVDQLDHAVKTAGMAAVGECGRLRIGIHALTLNLQQKKRDHLVALFLMPAVGRFSARVSRSNNYTQTLNKSIFCL